MKAAFTPVALQLRDGRRVTLRAITPQDREALHTAVKSLSPGSRHARFMMSLRELTPQMLELAIQPDPERDLALVAVDDGSAEGRIVGGARYASSPGSASCEFAVTIADEWQGVGLARRLMESLMEAARARGFQRMEGHVLTSNAPMRALARRLGFSDSPIPGDYTTRVVQRNLDEGPGTVEPASGG